MFATPLAWIGTAANRVECQVMSASIHHGRDDPTSQPDASTVTLEIVGPLPAEAVIGARVRVIAQVGATPLTRFDGEITDLGVGWDSVDVPRPRIIAAGDLARTGRRTVGDVPWPAELDGARAARILTLAGFPPDPARTDPGSVTVLARDVDRQPALGLAQAVASDGGGIVWQDLAGRILYADALHRRAASVAFEFRACDVGLGLGWEQTLEGLANDAYVRYGIAPDGGEQPEVHAANDDSIAQRGTFGVSLATQLASATDAQRRADSIVARQSHPAWVLGGLEVNLEIFGAAATAGILALDVHKLVSVTGLPAGSPATSAMLWVEGWRETIEATGPDAISWLIDFATSDYCRTAGTPRWDDLPPSATWDTTDPALRWNDAWCIPPQPPHGRWDDTPATLRWDQVAPATTWDTWTY